MNRSVGTSVALGIILQLTPYAHAGEPIGVAAIVKGKVGKSFGGHNAFLHVGEKIEEGSIITTGAAGFAKIILLDQTQLVLGPNASLAMDKQVKNVPNSVTLLQGTVRSKVMKDPLAQSSPERKKTRFVIRTKSATLGVRGTDFQVIYSRENQITSLVTYEGIVAMSNAQAEGKEVLVTPGNFSTSLPALSQPTVPTRLSPAQFEALKNAEPGALANTNSSPAKAPSAISPIPPGVDPRSFAGDPESIQPAQRDSQSPPAEGLRETKSGVYAPAAGGFIDIKTGLYIPPPPGSAFDPNTGVYLPPKSAGSFDPSSGKYLPPPGFQLDPRQGFIPAGASSSSTNGGPVRTHLPIAQAPLPPGSNTFDPFADARDPKDSAKFPRLWGQPIFPTSDPFCLSCNAPQVLPAPKPANATAIQFKIVVQ